MVVRGRRIFVDGILFVDWFFSLNVLWRGGGGVRFVLVVLRAFDLGGSIFSLLGFRFWGRTLGF